MSEKQCYKKPWYEYRAEAEKALQTLRQIFDANPWHEHQAYDRRTEALRKVAEAAKHAEQRFMGVDDGFYRGFVPTEFSLVSLALRELEGGEK